MNEAIHTAIVFLMFIAILALADVVVMLLK